jgi:hypothetical protein
MNKRWIALFFVCSLYFSAGFVYAQNKPFQNYLHLSGGISVPSGRFGGNVYTGIIPVEKPTGVAATGTIAALSYGLHLHKKFGVSFIAAFSSNRQKAKPIKTYLNNQYGNNVKTTAEVSNWQMVKIMTGMFYIVQPGRASKINFCPKLNIGVCSTSIPEIDWAVYSENGTLQGASNILGVKLPLAIAVQPSVDVMFYINRQIFLIANVAYFYATSSKKQSHYVVLPGTSGLTEVVRKQELSSFNTQFGFGIKV